jgi:hypothetical protein
VKAQEIAHLQEELQDCEEEVQEREFELANRDNEIDNLQAQIHQLQLQQAPALATPVEDPAPSSNRVIKFKIELQPGTALVYKRPYPMVPNEIAELKTQLQELLDKGYI